VTPRKNAAFWAAKRQANVERDRKALRRLRSDGWRVLVVWECWTRVPENKLIPRLTQFLDEPG